MVGAGDRRQVAGSSDTRSSTRCVYSGCSLHARELGVGQPRRACRGSGWRSPACRCRASAPRAAGRRSSSAAEAEDRAPSRSPPGSCGPSGGTSTATSRRRSRRRRRQPVQPLGVGDEHAVRRLPALEVGRRQRRPERRVVAERAERAHEVGVEPAAAARAARRRRRRSTPAVAWKISTVCARHRMRASSGISSPARPRGWPRPSQCSSSARIASAVRSERPIRLRDLRAPLAARLHQRARDLALVLDRQQPLEPRAQRAPRARPCGRTTRTPTTGSPSPCAWPSASPPGRRRRTAPPSAPSWPCSRRP